MKKINLKDYLTDQYLKSLKPAEIGPIVTISREFGCQAKVIAQKLIEMISEKLNKKGIVSDWKWINKEILEESATHLEVQPNRIQHVFEAKEKTTMEQIVTSLSERYYTSDIKIKKTIAKVIRSFANRGRVIIVGRGGVSVTKNHPKSLHVRLYAPFEWRVKQISEKRNLPEEKVVPYAMEIDLKRKKFRDFFSDKETDNSIFDVMLNRATLGENEIAETIFKLMEARKLVI